MRQYVKSILSMVLILALMMGLIPGSMAELTAQQANAIAMLNHIAVLTQEINASKNSRVFLEEAYTSLVNNIYPNAVDSATLGHLTALLDVMEN